MFTTTSSTFSVNPAKYSDDPIIEDFMRWVRYSSSDSDAVHNISVILKAYDKRKSTWERLKSVFAS